MPEREWLAWLAAMIDAEGYISFFHTPSGYVTTIGFTNKTIKIVDKVSSILDELGCSYKKRCDPTSHVWQVRIRDRDSVIKLVEAVYPWFIRLEGKAILVHAWAKRRGSTGTRPSLTSEDHVMATEIQQMMREGR